MMARMEEEEAARKEEVAAMTARLAEQEAARKVEDRVESIRFCPHRESARLSEHEKLEKQLAAEARERVSLGYAA